MSSFMSASIGRKFLMSLTGLFLISFLCIHLTLNLFLTFDDSGSLFNLAAHFMATNPIIRIIEPLLAIGFVIHIIWSAWITLENMRARPQKYEYGDQLLSWWAPAKNMFILGGMVLIFLVVHIANFWVKLKFTGVDGVVVNGVEMHNAYALVSNLFLNRWYDLLYIAGGILIGLHISHGFWSAFQTIGFSNQIWLKRLKAVAFTIGAIFAIGFSYIPIYFMIKF
ncbi:MAG: succinate dehydrogenase cytochrome b subunit [Bacteroidetes bacterium]|nr:succinate dehydrogenase cytochrome b subunit [Bacteroidota bacterium]MCL6101098.1 succinate dehydrogenase cytochrome b subunit [Bacteroidota bacterium]